MKMKAEHAIGSGSTALLLAALLAGCRHLPETGSEVDTEVSVVSSAPAQFVDLAYDVPGRFHPYDPHACLSAEHDWRPYQVRLERLPSHPKIDWASVFPRSALERQRPLKVWYVPGPELILSGNKITFGDGDEAIHLCLNEPATEVGEQDDCDGKRHYDDVVIDADLPGRSFDLLALELDLHSTGEELSRLGIAAGEIDASAVSGTILVTQEIVVDGPVNTGGYDLGLIADRIEFTETGSIDTKAPFRPGHEDIPFYRKVQDGYRGGNVVIASRVLTGPITISTQGQRGKSSDEFVANPQEFLFGTPVDEPLFASVHNWHRDFLSYARTLSQASPPHRPWTERTQVHPFFIGDQGRGAPGGSAGSVTIIANDPKPDDWAFDQSPGVGGDGLRGTYTQPRLMSENDTSKIFTWSVDALSGNPNVMVSEDGGDSYSYLGTTRILEDSPGFVMPAIRRDSSGYSDLAQRIQYLLVGPVNTRVKLPNGDRRSVCINYNDPNWSSLISAQRVPLLDGVFPVDDQGVRNRCFYVQLQVDTRKASTASLESMKDTPVSTCGGPAADPDCVQMPTDEEVVDRMYQAHNAIQCYEMGSLWECGTRSLGYPKQPFASLRGGDVPQMARFSFPDADDWDPPTEDPILPIFGRDGPPGNDGQRLVYAVDGLDIVPESFSSDDPLFAASASPACSDPECLSHGEFLAAVHALAPRYVDHLTSLGDRVFRSIDDGQLIGGSSGTQNSLMEAGYFYTAATSFCNGGEGTPFEAGCRYAEQKMAELGLSRNRLGVWPQANYAASPVSVHETYEALTPAVSGMIQVFESLRNTLMTLEPEEDLDSLLVEAIATNQIANANHSFGVAQANRSVLEQRALDILTEIDSEVEKIDDLTAEFESLSQQIAEAAQCDNVLCEISEAFYLSEIFAVVSFVIDLGTSVSDLLTFNIAGDLSIGDSLLAAIGDEAASQELALTISKEYMGLGCEDGCFPGFIESAIDLGKDISKTGKKVEDTAEALRGDYDELLDELRTENELVDAVARIRESASSLSDALAAKKSAVFQTIQAAEAAGNTEVGSLARQMEGIINQSAAAAEKIKALQKAHITAMEQIALNEVEISFGRSNIARANRLFGQIADYNEKLVETRGRIQGEIDIACEQVRPSNSLMLLVHNAYKGASRFYELQEPTDQALFSHVWFPSQRESAERPFPLEDPTDVLQRLFSDSTAFAHVEELFVRDDHIVEAMTPALAIRRRTLEEQSLIACDVETDTCPLTREHYAQVRFDQILGSGRTQFEFLPESDSRFAAFDVVDKQDWNPSVWAARQNQYARVLGARLRLFWDNEVWSPPPLSVLNFRIAHGEQNRFTDASDQMFDIELRSSEFEFLCEVADQVTSGPLTCTGIGAFEEEQTVAWSAVDNAFDTATATDFEDRPVDGLWGASLDGVWTVDFSPMIDELCPDSEPCDAWTSFLQSITAIQGRFFYKYEP